MYIYVNLNDCKGNEINLYEYWLILFRHYCNLKDVAIYEDDWWILVKQEDINI